MGKLLLINTNRLKQTSTNQKWQKLKRVKSHEIEKYTIYNLYLFLFNEIRFFIIIWLPKSLNKMRTRPLWWFLPHCITVRRCDTGGTSTVLCPGLLPSCPCSSVCIGRNSTKLSPGQDKDRIYITSNTLDRSWNLLKIIRIWKSLKY